MKGTWLDALRDWRRSVWDVMLGRAYATYSVPDIMDEVRLRVALCEIEELADDQADVDDGIPNLAMRILTIARAALATGNRGGGL